MICKQCKRDNPEGNKFCEYCGAKLEAGTMDLAGKRNKKLLLIIIAGILLAAIVATVIVFAVHTKEADENAADLTPSEKKVENNDDPAYKAGSYDRYEDDFIFPDSDQRYLTEGDVEYLTVEDTQQAINEIYARHGRIFKDEPYKSYFTSCEWYEPVYTAEEFKDDVFNDYEKKNIQLLAAHRDEVSVNITSEDAAIKYALDYCKKHHNPVDSAGCDGKTDRGYWIRGYNDMGSHYTTMFKWEITTDGDIYEEDGSLQYEHP